MDTPPGALCRLDHIPDGVAVAVDAELPDGPENLIVLREGEQARAWLNICPHAGRRLDWSPGQFLISKGLLVCAAHGASFRTGDGACVGGPCRGQALRAVGVCVERGWVRLRDAG
ncbi:Rieske (2Fe-2S) protein [Fulvimonas yonginensis]|uniref:Rieske 2Fe-2S domain-containing protein n=1 Tax=Fulvimonas yonginensis TaxID=1495200 RepID=A0ABU8J8Y7_9GAMM